MQAAYHEQSKPTPKRAEQIINLLHSNPSVEMTLADIADEGELPADQLAADLAELAGHALIEKATAVDGFDVYRFPAEYQRGTMAPPNS